MKKFGIILVCIGVIVSVLGLSVANLNYERIRDVTEGVGDSSEALVIDLQAVNVFGVAVSAWFDEGSEVTYTEVKQADDGSYYFDVVWHTYKSQPRPYVDYERINIGYYDSIEEAKNVQWKVLSPSVLMIEATQLTNVGVGGIADMQIMEIAVSILVIFCILFAVVAFLLLIFADTISIMFSLVVAIFKIIGII